MINAGGAKGERRQHRGKYEKISARLNTIKFFRTPPLKSTQAKRRQPYLEPLDEVSALGLGAGGNGTVTSQRPPEPSCSRSNALEIERGDVGTNEEWGTCLRLYIRRIS